jgi:hypothetical protein
MTYWSDRPGINREEVEVHTAIIEGPVLEGHKDAAVEVPFDPAVRWSLPANRLEAGRWGHRVTGWLNGIGFESAIVPRSGSFFLPLPSETLAAAAVIVGTSVRITVHSGSAASNPAKAPSAARKPRALRSIPEIPKP